LSVLLRKVEFNRDGGPHAITEVPADLNNVELRYSRALGSGAVTVGLGYDDENLPVDSGAGVRGFLTWQQGF